MSQRSVAIFKTARLAFYHFLFCFFLKNIQQIIRNAASKYSVCSLFKMLSLGRAISVYQSHNTWLKVTWLHNFSIIWNAFVVYNYSLKNCMPFSLTVVFRPWEGSEKEALPQSANTERHWAEMTSWVTYQNHPAYSSANALTPGLDFVSIISWRYSDEFPTTLQLIPRAAFPCYMALDFVKGSLDAQEHQKQGSFALVKTLSSEFIKKFWTFSSSPSEREVKNYWSHFCSWVCAFHLFLSCTLGPAGDAELYRSLVWAITAGLMELEQRSDCKRSTQTKKAIYELGLLL